MSTLGQRLRRERLARKLTLTQVEELAGMSRGVWSKYEGDKIQPNVVNLRRIAHALEGVDLHQLIVGP